MKPLYILKIGGSVATYKDKPGTSVRTELLKKIARAIKKAQAQKDFDLILIHGAGAAGHQLAKKFALKSGTKGDKKKLAGSLITCLTNQKLDNAVAEILAASRLMIFPVHTASTIIQKNGKIADCNLKIVREALASNCIPILYGEMVFDPIMGMSICSGDAIAPYLAKKLGAQKIFFASDIDGVFDKDPHIHKDARLLEKISLKEIWKNEKINLSGSHNVDVTGGLWGKIKNLDLKHSPSLQSVEIFNGLKENNYARIILGEKFLHTILGIK